MYLVPSTVAELCAAVLPGDAELIRRDTDAGAEVTLLVSLDGRAVVAQVVRPDDTVAAVGLSASAIVRRHEHPAPASGDTVSIVSKDYRGNIVSKERNDERQRQ